MKRRRMISWCSLWEGEEVVLVITCAQEKEEGGGDVLLWSPLMKAGSRG